MSKSFWAIIGIVVLVFGGIIVFHNNKGTNGSTGTPTNHVEGSGSTGVTLVEYGDYECPYCGEYYPTVKQIASEYSTQIRFQFRNLPLSSIHPNAFAAARAAEAASLQGKFWQMHDLLYENQNAWVNASDPTSTFDSYATQLGLNLTQFEADSAGSKVDNSINADLAAFAKTGEEEATPTFFLDGKKINPSNTVASFESLINAAIKQKAKTASSSTTQSTASPTTTSTGAGD